MLLLPLACMCRKIDHVLSHSFAGLMPAGLAIKWLLSHSRQFKGLVGCQIDTCLLGGRSRLGTAWLVG